MQQTAQHRIYVVIGHRGTGKTHWTQQVAKYYQKKHLPISCFDLDLEIEKQTHTSIAQWFQKGECFFREQESKVFEICYQKARKTKHTCLISVGAGYNGSIPSDCYVIFLKRYSDRMGRIFLDPKYTTDLVDHVIQKDGQVDLQKQTPTSTRPRLCPELSPIEEYQYIYKQRNKMYHQQKDEVWTRLDYFSSFQRSDEIFLGYSELPFKNGVLTLKENNFHSQIKFHQYIDRKLKWNLKYFELRDDQISKDFLQKILKRISVEKLLLSFRKKQSVLFQSECRNVIKRKKIMIDWPFEWGRCKEYEPQIYSLHQKDQSVSLATQLKKFSSIKNAHLKLAIQIDSFEELKQCHQWWMKDVKRRSFHPRSKEGRYTWYRSLFGPKQFLYFLREDDENGVSDQPVISESVRVFLSGFKKYFMAVIGDPIEHSRTPFFFQTFLQKKSTAVVKILIKEHEMTKENLQILKDMGLRWLAITSPLKKKASALIQSSSIPSAINTMDVHHWKGWNTDLYGAKKWTKQIQKNKKVAVWGGGGILEALKKALPNANFYSTRTGQLRDASQIEYQPNVLVWAVSSERTVCWPPKHWKPSVVLDVSYTDDSIARQYALQVKAFYISGLSWFEEQATQQKMLFDQICEME